MKKLIPILLLVTVLMYSCKQPGTKSTSSTEKAKLTTDPFGKKIAAVKQGNLVNPVYKSLNGIDEGDVERMTNDFETTIFQRVFPRNKTSIWLRAEIFDQILDLLIKERGSTTSTTIGTPDGFRIYFINDTSDKSDLSVAIVSTFFNGYKGHIKLHKDYYEHDGDHKLFNMGTIKGEKCIGNCSGGALLYTHCVDPHCDDNNCIADADHRVTRLYGERMISAFGNDVINTKSVWFDFELLKSLNTIRSQFAGIRIYYGNYGEIDSDGNDIPVDLDTYGYSKKRDRDTFVISLTKPGSKREDLFDCAAITKSWVNLFSKKDVYNNGELCPSHCN
ncbi:MAG TPA: hypothetical protein VIM77_13435 [Mucilaginibacter sp.]